MPAYKVQSPLRMLQEPTESVLLALQRDFEAYLKTPTDTDTLRAVGHGAWQMHGIFVMLEQPQAASLMREIWMLAQRLADSAVSDVRRVRQVLSEVLLQAPRYFEWLQREGDKPYFDLLPLIEQLRVLRLGRVATTRAPQPPTNPASALATILELRGRLQNAILRLLHGDHRGLQQAADVFDALQGHERESVLQRTWGLASMACRVELEQLQSAGSVSHFHLLLRDLDRLLRTRNQSATNASDADDAQLEQSVQTLCQRLEQQLSGSESGLRKLADFQHTMSTPARRVPEATNLLDHKALVGVTALLRLELTANQEAIDQFARNPVALKLLEGEPKRLSQIANTLVMLELPVPERLVREQITQIEQWLSGAEVADDEQLLVTASHLAAVQSCLESFSDPSYSRELTAVTSQPDKAAALALLQQLELRRARRLIAHESGRFIDQIWLFATNYMGSHETPDWEEILPVLRVVGRLFLLLECERAAAITKNLCELVDESAQGYEPTDRRLFVNGCAQIVVALESYLGLFEIYDEPDQHVLDQAEQHLAELNALMQLQLEQGPTVSHRPVAESEPAVAAGIEQISPHHSAISASSAVPDATPNQSLPAITQAMSPTQFGSGVYAAEQVVSDNDMSHDDYEMLDDGLDDIIEVFLEEARNELDNIRQQLPVWRKNLAQREPVKEIRRSFHTLKGSGRMVGETTLGDFAWQFEHLLNSILDGQLVPSESMVEAIAAAAQVLAQRLAQPAPQGLGDAPIFQQLGKHADALRLGHSSQLPSLPEPVVEAEAAAEPVPEPVVESVAEPVSSSSQPMAPALAESIDVEDELLEALLEEGSEILDASDTTLQQWREELENLDLINNLRRGMHTLKGGARIAGLSAMGDLAHAMESILDAVSRQEIKGQTVLDPLQRTLDRLSSMLGQLGQRQSITPADDLIQFLQQLLNKEASTHQAHGKQEDEATEAILLSTFVQETATLLDACDLTLRRWGQSPDNRELLADLLRDLQTLRGNARLAGYAPMGELAGVTGDVLRAVEKGQLEANDELVGVLEQALDGLNRLLKQVRDEQALKRPDALLSEISTMLSELQQKTQAAPTTAQPKPSTAAVRKALATAGNSIRIDAGLLANLANQIGESSIFRSRVEQGVNAFRSNLGELSQTVNRLRQQLRRLEIETEAQILFRHEEGREHGRDFDPLELDRFSELQQVSRSLMEIVDDLANVQNGLEDQAQSVTHLLYQQGQVNQEVQQNMMKTRMVEFSTVVPRLRRVLRQAAQELGKKADLVVQGAESDVDRTVLEQMVPALEHMLRNSAAHGIESPEQRLAQGKAETGTVLLSLRREGAEQVMELRDDGAGLNFDAIRAKGEAKGLLRAGQKTREQDLIALLMQPGFSTATKVDQISGRGVGLDVLNEAIIAMRGALQIQSRPKQGTTFTVRLPFSLEVTRALLVQAGEDTFAVPLLSIEGVDRLAPGELATYLAGEPVTHAYGEHAYPLHNIGVLFGSEPAPLDETEDQRPPVLLFRSAEATVALQVDAIQGKEEIVIKPVAPQLNSVPGISGATVLGDGRVVIVLDPASLARNIETLTGSATFVPRVRAKEPERLQALVVDDSITMRKITTRLLERHNVLVRSAKDGVEAVAALEEHPPSFVILDIEMPRMDGFELLAHIRNQPHMKNMPVIMVTSRSGEKHRGRAMRLGVDDYLIKPYQDEELLSTVRRVLEVHGVELTL